MKRLYSFFLLMILLGGKCFSQQNIPIIHLDSLPPQGILLDKGWKFHEGDDTAWANANYDDSQWQTADLSQYKTYFSSFIKKNIGWFRRKIYIDSSSNNNQAAILLSQLGASDWFINGRLFIQFGKIIAPGKIENYNPHNKPILFPGNLSDSVIIAIRFASNASVRPWLFESTDFIPFTIRIAPWMNALSDYKAALVGPRLPIGNSFMSIGFGLLFILLYSFTPKERTYLLFATFCFLGGITPAIESLLFEGSPDINYFGLLSFVYELVGKAIGMLVLSIISLEILKKITIYQWCIIVYVMVIDSLIFFYFGRSKPVIIAGDIVRGLFALELLRLAVLGFWKGNYIMGLVGFSSAFLNFTYIAAYYTPINFTVFYSSFNSFLFFVLITIYLAVKYARTSKYLAVQLSEVEKLSRQNLEKEQEKQQILSTQNEKLEEQVAERTASLNNSLKELKEAQSQLIQSEKMASLGELTAGIAHEIQNPLNFVNNFSEVNSELIDEMGKAVESGNLAEAKDAYKDIKENFEKINYHGKRAEAIVKNMLMHSRSSTGQKEPVELNALADEYLRLSYHGLRAKDKSFNATMQTHFDEKIGTINLIPQDFGRVLLNLYNNAFYSVTEKKKIAGNEFEPTVSVSTKLISPQGTGKNAKVEIRIRDNGLGVPLRIQDKIFQPFFTSKPTGQGTGLGLSLSYDILTKEHEGTLKLNSQEGEYAEFIISLPLQENA